ncbi:hypothetical protein DNU06_08795 [Putridiphycobacter roseus]|uniref:Peptidase M43 pregnancy-associated plasma-A domain-containing protein n=1 Tax=Putridiphycobacter roseus TaxID=2219161 RepID=A0A2W1NRQ6_9FLAO|nr:M43 family zinc metalloprotease [Putridiphycobacter roseus]PZE17358.1 hypothetical protein DNU06_08795 [Putridiphycobacter roseus]
MKKVFHLFFCILFLSSTTVFSQNVFESLPCLEKKFSIVVHITKDSLGEPNILESDIIAHVTSLNNLWDDICVSFEICEFRYIDNFQYDIIDNIDSTEWPQLQVDHHVANHINMFFVQNTLEGSSFASLGGVANTNSGGLVIVKTHGFSVIAHEMGHFFGLYHTWEGSLSANPELVDGSNCDTAGDLVCDTPADPFYEDSGIAWVEIGTNEYLYDGLDANGDYYIPNVENIMSYYPGGCNFTHGQYLRMANTYLNSNPKMW